MKLQTTIPLRKEKNTICYKSNLMMVGSCFSENIGEKLKHFKFDTKINPFGILFHPKAIEKFISDSINLSYFNEDDVFFHNERWHCFDSHSNLSSVDKNDLINTLNTKIKTTHKHLLNTTHIIITLGTSWIYTYKNTQKIVANCHKIPQSEFSKRILEITEITGSLKRINQMIYSINKDIQIIYTVSPVRHIKDGIIENQRSKSHLISAIHQLKKCCYFPSYELMMDELRDYRFYAEDLIHPSSTGINYIWERFCEVWLDDSEKHIRKDIDNIQKGLQHRPFNVKSESHQLFLKQLEKRILKISKRFPYIEF